MLNVLTSVLTSVLSQPPPLPPRGGFRQISTIFDRFRPIPLTIPTSFVENSDHIRPIQKTMTDQY